MLQKSLTTTKEAEPEPDFAAISAIEARSFKIPKLSMLVFFFLKFCYHTHYGCYEHSSYYNRRLKCMIVYIKNKTKNI